MLVPPLLAPIPPHLTLPTPLHLSYPTKLTPPPLKNVPHLEPSIKWIIVLCRFADSWKLAPLPELLLVLLRAWGEPASRALRAPQAPALPPGGQVPKED